jgi:hypothetical protein
MDGHQTRAQRLALRRFQRAAGDVDQPIAIALDQPPAGAAEARIDAQDANRLPAHGSVDSSGA